jgi:CheY-like chemotaxis protein
MVLSVSPDARMMSDAGPWILVVEDEYFLARELVGALGRHGLKVIGPVAEVGEALAIVASGRQIDGAVLDINLHNETIFPLADLLREKSIPFVFATGYEQSAIPAAYADVPRWQKPFEYEQLAAALPFLWSS